MKKFSFTLQALLDVNSSLEKEQKNQLTIINNRIEMLQLERKILLSEINNRICTYVQLLKELLNINQVKIHNDYIKNLNNRTHFLEIKIEEENNEKKKIQHMLIETITKRKSLEKLKEKQYKLFLKELQKEEEKSIDDFTSYSFIQK